MSTGLPLPPPGFDDLSVDEKVKYLQSLWDRIAADPERIPVPEWHKEVLSERLEERKTASANIRDWEYVRDELKRELKEKESKR